MATKNDIRTFRSWLAMGSVTALMTAIFERFNAGLSQSDWMQKEAADTHARPAAGTEADKETSSHAAPVRELTRALKTLRADLTALRKSSTAGPDTATLTTPQSSPESDSVAVDPTASENSETAPVTSEILKRRLKDLGSLQLQQVNTNILLADVLKVVKAAVKVSISQGYNFAGVRMMTSGVLS